MKKPERQPDRKMSMVLEKVAAGVVAALCPPPKRARFETDVAARYPRPTLRDAVVHKPEVALKMSTTLKGTCEFCPPPKRARFETDVAATVSRATLRIAVIHKPEATLKMSTTLVDEVPQPPPNRAKFETDVAAM
jgi:hypothetical protein